LFGIYEFQNKTSKKVEDKSEFYDASKGELLNNFFEKDKDLKKSGNFNKWFNEQFDKHKLDDTTENGYGDWLKSNEGRGDVYLVLKNTDKVIRPAIPKVEVIKSCIP
jgi:hypothetical protein